MPEKRRAGRILIVVALLWTITAARPAVAARPEEPVHTVVQADATNTDWETYQDIPDTFEPVAENAAFQLFANRATLAFKVVDRRSGYVWHSNLDEVGEDDRLNKTWTAFAQSGVSIDYLDPRAIDERASIANAEHTLDFRLVDGGFEAAVTFTEPSITLVLAVRLEENGVSVAVPFDSIRQENPEFKLGLLHLYPFFGATRDDSVPGYMFIPDGPGALIPFAAETKAHNMFYGRYYGADLGMIGYLPWDPLVRRAYRMSIPVTGMVHGEEQNAFVAIVEDGAAYGEIQAHPAGVTTNFNFLYTAFIYNESYFQPTNRAGAGVTALQRTTNAFDVKIHYRFLTADDGDYVGMARSYQRYLLEQGTLKKVDDPGSDIGIRLEFLGAEKEKVLFWWRSIPMTTIDQMAGIVDDLGRHRAVENPQVIYYGWQPHGASAMPPQSLKPDRRLGTVAELRSLTDEVAAAGGHFYLYLDPQAALRGVGGYSPRRDLATSIANANLIGYNRDKVNYYFNLDTLRQRFSSLSQDVSTALTAGLALDGLGSTLYSDFKSGHVLNRENAILEYQHLLSENGSAAFYMPNDYVFGFMDAYYDMPLTNSGYIYATEAVPFLQIVLAGYVPCYGPALNFSSNLQHDLLKLADFGVYPSYLLTHEPTAKILNTQSIWIYTSSYQQWAPDIEQTYRWLNRLLGPVKGQPVVGRQELAEGVVATTYANGQQIVVNYSAQPFSEGDFLVPARDAALREVGP